MEKSIKPILIAIIKQGEKYLLTKRIDEDRTPQNEASFHNMWQFPGGGLEFGEEIEEGLRREVREELGIQIKNIQVVPYLTQRIHKDAWHGIFLIFLCEMEDPSQQIILNEEASEYGWFTIEEMKTIPTLPKIHEVMQEVKKHLTNQK